MEPALDGIFISYRRDDSAGYAGRLYDRLAAHFGADRVFMDVEGIEPGTDFVVAIEKALVSCRVLIVLMGDEWLDITDARGRRRLEDPNDFIRLETSTALNRDIRVLPVLLDGTPMPDADSLPDDLKALVRRHAVELTHKQWEATSGELISTLEKILSQAPAAEATAATAPPGRASGTQNPGASWTVPGMIGFFAVLVAGFWAWTLLAPEPASPQPVTKPAPPVSVAAPLPPNLVSPDGQVDFGRIEADTTKVMEWTIRNDGSAASSITLSLDGANASAFSIPVETCSAGVRAQSQCSVSVEYRPHSAGEHTARLSARTGESVASIALHGFGYAVPEPPAEPAAAAPGATPGTPAQVKPVVVNPTPPVKQSPAAPMIEAPRITTLEVIARSGGVKLCYRTEHATRLVISPNQLTAESPARGCLDIALSEPTTLTVIAVNAVGQDTKQVQAIPEKPASTSNENHLLPSAGDRWTYRLRGKWANSPKRTVTVTVTKVDGELIYESMTLDAPNARPGGNLRSSNTQPAIIDWTWLGWEFTPWFVTDSAIRDGRWSGFAVPDVGAHWTNWRGDARVAGREEVTVPAGTFSTIKVQVLAQRKQTGSQTEMEVEPTQTKLTVWYSPKAKRYVKMERIVDAANGTEIERDQIQLVSFATQ